MEEYSRREMHPARDAERASGARETTDDAAPGTSASRARRVMSRASAELASRVVIERVRDGETRIVTASECEARRAIEVRECSDATIVLEADAACAKVFLERCARTEVRVRGRVVSETAEIYGCRDVRVVYERTMATTQIDDSEDVRLGYGTRDALGAVVFATSARIEATFADGTSTRLDRGDALAVGDQREIPQYITRFVDGELVTERLIRGKDEYPTTERELRAALGDALAAEHLDTAPARAELRKDRGNAAFKDGNFSQAAVHYTEALDLDPSHVVALCNRAQCFLRLGEHEKALADAEAAIVVKSDYVKAHFRRGLALHALKRFTDAVRAFERAIALDPTNVQARDSLRVAEYAAMKASRDAHD